MSVVVMARGTPQYLDVPKVRPGHRLRTSPRSRSRGPREEPREVVRPEIVISPIKFRPQSPPMPLPSPESGRKTAQVNAAHTPVPTFDMLSDYANKQLNTAPQVQTEDVKMTDPDVTNYHDLNGSIYTPEALESCSIAPPEPEIPLRQKLIGTWRLESYTAYPLPESQIQRPTYPMTKNVTGFIMYTPDGYMSATMLIPGQPSFRRGEGDDPYWAEAAKRCFTYGGPYYITNEGESRGEVLRHTFQICNLPGWVNDIQVRTHRFEEDGQVLVLGSEEPTEIKGDKRVPIIKWRRARDNSNGVPPPPTPQLKLNGQPI